MHATLCPGFAGMTTLTPMGAHMTSASRGDAPPNSPRALREATTVAVVGGGVAGLTAAMLLRRSGIACIVLERQSRAYVEQRQRAGIVEYRGVRMFQQWGLPELLGRFPANNTMQVTLDGQLILT